MTIQKTFIFKFNIAGADYSFTVFADTQEEAIQKLAKDLGIIASEIAKSV